MNNGVVGLLGSQSNMQSACKSGSGRNKPAPGNGAQFF